MPVGSNGRIEVLRCLFGSTATPASCPPALTVSWRSPPAVTSSAVSATRKANKVTVQYAAASAKFPPFLTNSEVKALFSDINAVTTKHLTEISKVISFQSRHQRKLLTHYKKRNEKLEETLVKMKQEMQHMTKKLNEQSAYIAKMENSFQHQSTMAPPPVSQKSRAPYPAQGHKPALQIPYNSPAPLLRQFSATSSNENTEVDEMSLFRKPNSVSRMSVNKPPQDGRMGAISSRLSSQNMLGSHSSQSPSVSRFQGAPLTPELTFNLSSKWESPIFKSSSSFRGSMSSLVSPSP
ncbi:probable E3 SUMO-protein ligase RNF212 isoform X1 [Oryzias melastigma]|uniref:probable E3 SUMO-protein ligase RNF212 isoform X1 n=1 Tax=Oryzias melastigma TaxID=30732 RepID=UPI000CF83359|nr:probable E3 SUMO-protein ligase RNF212 isoform X1 [Oryzias melastigma]